MSSTPAHRLHELVMEFLLEAGLLQLDRAIPGQPVSVSQAFALHELDTRGPLSQRELGERLRLDKSTVSRLAAELERKGLLIRERDPDNRRLYRLRLTEAGRAVHGRMAAVNHEQYLRWARGISHAEQEALVTGLAALVREIHREPPPWHQPPEPGTPRASRGRTSGTRARSSGRTGSK
jgi:DNA-binding MarR family transcriptional regulator